MNKQKLNNFRNLAIRKLGQETFDRIDRESQLIADNILNLQQQFSLAMKAYMDQTGKGFNEVQEELHISSNKLNSILKGTGNFTIRSISEILGMIGKKVSFNIH
ncbi:hypothetical protein [Facilibium subflavum]|uniref:hypothetical protein n=1 Tax=Facilibium subflavum TaxID=2219058 RepID=UPI000E64673E|nr:hypothetical protein [Facilibium subflavum]